jgi:hypothetical protein
MPTPFQHLVYAERLLQHSALPSQVRRLLRAARGPYLLGSTAGDVQVITSQPRVTTHFYHLADIGLRPAVTALLTAHPELASPFDLSPDHAAFLTGYLIHLVWDEIWARDVFIPLYRDGDAWQERRDYFLHHNALRVLLDREAYTAVQSVDGLLSVLSAVTPCHWLPFASDAALIAWRDWLVEQLADSATLQTATVFAQRMQVPVEQVEALVVQMRSGAYMQVPDWAAAIRHYETLALEESVATVLRYWGIGDRLVPADEVQQASIEV